MQFPPWLLLLPVLGVALHGFYVQYRVRRYLKTVERAFALQSVGKRAEGIALLETTLARPAPVKPTLALLLHMGLTTLYQAEGRHPEAEAQARAALELLRQDQTQPVPSARILPGKTAALEAEILQKLGDTLDAQGKTEEARILFTRAEASLLSGSSSDPIVLDQRAKQLERDGKHEEAARLFLRAAQTEGGIWTPKVRAHTLCQAMLALYNAGRYAEGVETAHQALQLLDIEPEPEMRLLILRQGANCALSDGDLDTAQALLDQAIALCHKRGLPDETAQTLMQQSQVALMRGDLTGAEQIYQKAAALSPDQQHMADGMAFEIAVLRGNCEQALAYLQTRADSPFNRYAHLQRRMAGAYALARAQTLTEMGRLPEALGELRLAEKELAADERLGPVCRGVRVWIEAEQGAPTAPANLKAYAETLDRQAQARNGDRTAQRDMLTPLARGFAAAGDCAAALRVWEHYRSARPRPAYLPYCWYFTGECHCALGSHDAARAAWQAAVDTGLVVYYTRRAKERLAEE